MATPPDQLAASLASLRLSRPAVEEARQPNGSLELRIPASRAGNVIGVGGAVVRGIEASSRCSVRVIRSTPLSTVVITARQGGSVQVARDAVVAIVTSPARPPRAHGTSAAAKGFAHPSTWQSRVLYVDAGVATEYIFAVETKTPWSMARSMVRVRQLAEAARKSGVALKFFHDAARTGGALDKWYARRRREVVKGERRVPQSSAELASCMLREHGIASVFSCALNNDDTLAAHAHHDGVDIFIVGPGHVQVPRGRRPGSAARVPSLCGLLHRGWRAAAQGSQAHGRRARTRGVGDTRAARSAASSGRVRGGGHRRVLYRGGDGAERVPPRVRAGTWHEACASPPRLSNPLACRLYSNISKMNLELVKLCAQIICCFVLQFLFHDSLGDVRGRFLFGQHLSVSVRPLPNVV